MEAAQKTGLGADKTSRATFAAILTAGNDNCDCKTCKILKGVRDDLTKEFTA